MKTCLFIYLSFVLFVGCESTAAQTAAEVKAWPVEAQARAMIEKYARQQFTKCFDTYRQDTGHTIYGDIFEFKTVLWTVQPSPVSTADRLNGITFRASVNWYCAAQRVFFATLNSPSWTPWVDCVPGISGVTNVPQSIQLHNQKWEVSPDLSPAGKSVFSLRSNIALCPGHLLNPA